MAWREDRFDVMIFSDKVFPTGGINAQGARRVMYYDMAIRSSIVAVVNLHAENTNYSDGCEFPSAAIKTNGSQVISLPTHKDLQSIALLLG